MIIDLIRILVLLVVTFIYAMFDLFNKRNLPDWFAYATLAIGLILTFSYPFGTVIESLVIAAAIGSLGYLGYRAGYIGLGDVFEFLFISLVVPIQALPYLISVPQVGLPFALSVIISAGYLAGLTMPLYYIRKARVKKAIPDASGRKFMRRRTLMSMIVLVMYAVLILLIALMGSLKLFSILLVSIIAIPAFIILRYGGIISQGMVELVYPSELVEGDMIAVSMMSENEVSFFKKKTKRFGILADTKLIAQTKGIRRRIPVYKNAIPLAVFVFAGVVASLLIGNILLLIVSSMLAG